MVAYFCLWAYRIRMSACGLHIVAFAFDHARLVCFPVQPVHDYGYLIHEFDPWSGSPESSARARQNWYFRPRFNFRVAQYLSKHGWFKFAKWRCAQSCSRHKNACEDACRHDRKLEVFNASMRGMITCLGILLGGPSERQPIPGCSNWLA